MKNRLDVDRTALNFALQHVAAVTRVDPSKLSLYGSIRLTKEGEFLLVRGSNGHTALTIRCHADGDMPDVLVPATLADIIGGMRGPTISMTKDGNSLAVTDGLDKTRVVANFGDNSLAVQGKRVTFGPQEYFVTGDVDVTASTLIPGSLWGHAVSRMGTVLSDATQPYSQGVRLRTLPDGVLHMSSVNAPTACVMWNIPRSAGYVIAGDMDMLIPKAPLSLMPTANKVAIQQQGNRFAAADTSGLWTFSCPLFNLGNLFDVTVFLGVPHHGYITTPKSELTRCCGIARNYIAVIGEGVGTVQTGRLRLMTRGSDVTFMTAGDMGHYDGAPLIIEGRDGDFDVTIAHEVLSRALTCFSGSVRAEIGEAHVGLSSPKDEGLFYFTAPLRAVWND